MSKAYTWALLNPLRKIFYNLVTTGLAVLVALLIGTIELLQVFIHVTRMHGSFLDSVASLDFGALGYLVVGMFLFGELTDGLGGTLQADRFKALIMVQMYMHSGRRQLMVSVLQRCQAFGKLPFMMVIDI